MRIVKRLYLVAFLYGFIPVSANAALSTENLSGILNAQDIHSAEYSPVVASLKVGAYDDAKSAAANLVANKPDKYPAHLLLVLACLGGEDFAAIDKHLVEIDRNLPQFSSALRENLFRALVNERRYFRALAIAEPAPVAERSAKLNLEIGKVYIAQSKYEDAAVALSRALAKDNTLVEAHYELGRVLIIQGKYQNALDEFAAVARAGNASDRLYQLIGASYLGLGKYQEALQAYGSITKNNPDDVLARLNMGIIQLHLKKYDEAFAHLSASQKKDKTADSVAAQLLSLVAVNKHASARDVFNGLSQELASDPLVQLAALSIENAKLTAEAKNAIARVFPDAHFIVADDVAFLTSNSSKVALAALLYKQGMYLAVDEFYTQQGSQKIHPWLSLVYARAQIKTNKIDRAIESYRALGREYPALVSPKLELAEAYYHQKKYAEAIDVYSSLPVASNVEWQVQLGNLYNANQQYDLAIKQYTKALQVQPDPYIVNQIAATYSERLKQPEKAVKVINDAKLAQQSPLILDTLGWAYFSLNDLKQSLAAYKQLLAVTGNNQSPETFAKMARAYEKNGDLKQSRLLYEMALNTGHEFEDEEFAKNKLAQLDVGGK